MKEIKDLVEYLREIEKLSKKLNSAQKGQLREIIRTILVLLVALRRSSKLGEHYIVFNGKELDV